MHMPLLSGGKATGVCSFSPQTLKNPNCDCHDVLHWSARNGAVGQEKVTTPFSRRGQIQTQSGLEAAESRSVITCRLP